MFMKMGPRTVDLVIFRAVAALITLGSGQDMVGDET
jgi:hypothetical protein